MRDSSDKIVFTNYKDLVSKFLTDYEVECMKARTYMREGKREIIIGADRICSPKNLGFPLEDTSYRGVVDDAARRAITVACSPRDVDGDVRFVSTVFRVSSSQFDKE